MSASAMAVPTPTADSATFWQRCRAGELVIPQCRRCNELNWFPRAMCRFCSSTDLDWIRMSGRGTVYSFSVVHRRPSPELPAQYVLALIDLDEGVRMMSHVVGCPPEAVHIGMRVSVRFEALNDDISLPVFRPLDGGEPKQ